LYGLLITGTGWTARIVDSTPWPDVLDLLGYWKVSPPVHVLVRAYMGGGKSEQSITPTSEAELAAAIAGFERQGP
jgi:hypothetical protein